MRRVAVLLLLTVTAFAQAVTRIPPDDAAKHLIKGPQPKYPELAEAARIQGNVILQIRIDESGTASVLRLVQGHPMLAPAAIEAVKAWKYQPFEIDGKAAQVNTVVMVTFGNPGNHASADRAEMVLQDSFWTAEEAADAALNKGDYAHADELGNQAWSLVSADKDLHGAERWQCLTTMWRVSMLQQKNEQAEQYYKKALALHENKWEDKDSPDIAVSLANLAALFAEEKKFDLAREHAARSFAIFQKNFKKAGSGSAGPRQAYGRGAAQESRLLVEIAQERNDPADMDKQCHVTLDWQSFLSPSEQNSLASACQQATGKPAGKP